MIIVMGSTVLTPKVDKVGCLQDLSVSNYIKSNRERKIQTMEAKSEISDIIRIQIKHFVSIRFRDNDELKDLLEFIVNEVSLEEIVKAIDISKNREFKHCVTYLLNCVS